MGFNDDNTPEEFIALAQKIDPLAWLKEREAEDRDYYKSDPSNWPESGELQSIALSAQTDILTGIPYPEVILTILPAAEPWMAPYYLKIGNWNSVPRAEEHAALVRYWAEKYGATVACITFDVIEFTVAKLPKTREDCLELARQQYVDCNDIVDQGVGSVEALASLLLDAEVWSFWWD